MSFGAAVSRALRNYATFSGRARRSEFWWFALFNLLVSIAANIIDVTTNARVIDLIVALALFLPSLAVSVRRLHDTNRRGWWVLICVIPIVGFFWLLVLQCEDSTRGSNRFGDSPKYPGSVPRPGHVLVPARGRGRSSGGVRRPRKAIPWMLALVPAVSFGFLAAAPFVYLAVRRRALKCTVAAIAYSAACVAEWSLAMIDFPENSLGDNIGSVLFIALMVIGTAHAFVWRETLAERPVDHATISKIAPADIPAVVDETAETCARLQQKVAALRSFVATHSDLPLASRRLLAETFVPIGRVLEFCANGGHADAQLRAIEPMLDDYLPTSLHAYERLPRQFARTDHNPAGRTATEELEIQLRLIHDRATELAASLYEQDALRLQEQSAFLQSKFGRSELDLSGIDLPPAADTVVTSPPAATDLRPHPKSRQ